ncbi:MAG: bifunctional 2-C-methyl-D-erythritol 4-phosphate cytidylyltransferase/2-C-methyl-D-erythritol 2,4-cyclodiphosphate synthase [Alphaproteobacteria bacterium]|nr:bifunctional 2-C-methyl-D-erythritol 4-phosphate cytidylyltransferase/2-C-methyl-D-erythritol 2,4-cyclodiphosphate synthase [Alphaproteobacteria bacterium]
MTVVGVIVAAGQGSRFGGETPKQYLALAGKPVLRHAVEALQATRSLAAIRVVIDPAQRAAYEAAVGDLGLLEPVAGGSSRQESVKRGLESVIPLAPAHVLIHDGARPFADPALIGRVLAALDRHDGAVPTVPVSDALKRVEGEQVTAAVARAGLHRAQTPQGFRFRAILAAHRALDPAAGVEDDAEVARQAGLAVAAVAGAEENLKITTAGDLARAERLLGAAGEVRTGTGFDVHRFGPGRALKLGGIEIPFERGLVGHSDADVALHALVDALLGAIAAGDIGHHFPPSDPRWRGADSGQFVLHAAKLVAARGARVAHVDLTIICEAPKVAPHRAAMAARIAALLGIAIDRVSVKATTTEGLGFTGRREGIAAQAVATIMVPG